LKPEDEYIIEVMKWSSAKQVKEIVWTGSLRFAAGITGIISVGMHHFSNNEIGRRSLKFIMGFSK